jgi:hypothetical protein
MYFMDLARRCRFLSHNTLDLRVARELRTLGDELEAKAREAQVIADAAVPDIVQAYAPAQAGCVDWGQLRRMGPISPPSFRGAGVSPRARNP